jgi:SAM-dependent methyltransferase
MMNPFEHQTAARRYAQSRPYFHPLVIERIKILTGRAAGVPFPRALDVACGTGMSARALAEISERVCAVDLSTAMLSQATPHARISLVAAAAEHLPFVDDIFDLITVGLGFHWFDQDQFLSEAARVLRTKGWLVIYNHWFGSKMLENALFEDWCRHGYKDRYPSPVRNTAPPTDEMLSSHGFEALVEEGFDYQLILTPEEMRDYLMTQSNVIVKVEEGDEPLEEVARWLDAELEPLFPQTQGTFIFHGSIWFLRKG